MTVQRVRETERQRDKQRERRETNKPAFGTVTDSRRRNNETPGARFVGETEKVDPVEIKWR